MANKCLMCNGLYGKKEFTNNYCIITAKCGCTGVGRDCSVGDSSDIARKFFGNRNPCHLYYTTNRCYVCRQEDEETAHQKLVKLENYLLGIRRTVKNIISELETIE